MTILSDQRYVGDGLGDERIHGVSIKFWDEMEQKQEKTDKETSELGDGWEGVCR